MYIFFIFLPFSTSCFYEYTDNYYFTTIEIYTSFFISSFSWCVCFSLSIYYFLLLLIFFFHILFLNIRITIISALSISTLYLIRRSSFNSTSFFISLSSIIRVFRFLPSPASSLSQSILSSPPLLHVSQSVSLSPSCLSPNLPPSHCFSSSSFTSALDIIIPASHSIPVGQIIS